MKRYCLVNKIKKEFLKEYIDIHKDPWKEVLEALKEAGTHNEFIFMYDNLAIVIIECEDIDVYMKSFGNSEAGKKWFEMVAPWLEESQFIDETGKLHGETNYLEKVFDLKQQLDGKLYPY